MAVEVDELVEAICVLDQQIREREDRTLLVKIQFEEYPISCEVLDQVFSRFGNIESIEKFDQDAQFHSRIRFWNRDSALEAFNCYDGRFIYENCCLMKLSLVAGEQLTKIEARNRDIDKDPEGRHVQEESSISDGVNKHSALEIVEAPIAASRQEFEFEAISESEPLNSSEMAELLKQLRAAPMSESWCKMAEIGEQLRVAIRETVDELREWREEIEAEAEAPTKEPSQEIASNSIIADKSGEQEISCDSLTLSSTTMIDAEMETIEENCLRSLVKTGIRKVSIRLLESSNALKVFVKMTRRDVWIETGLLDGNLVFDPGITGFCVTPSKFAGLSPKHCLILLHFDGLCNCWESTRQSLIAVPYDRGKELQIYFCKAPAHLRFWLC